MTKRRAIAGAFALVFAALVFQPTQAAAEVDFEFYFDFGPYWDYHYDRYDYYDYNARLSCRQARRILRRHHGFRNINTRDCSGDYYKFTAWLDGHKYRIKMNAWSGQIVRLRRVW